ncbi:MAG: hypothetical protein KBC17_00315 [Candidatus Pacebacteria bacterium]|nr:hypothetical protein [Candidatus Paceibacterota bacterium]
MDQDTQERLRNEATNFNGEIPEIFDEKYCLVNELLNITNIGKLNSAERIFWTLGQERLNAGNKTEGIFFLNEAFVSAINRYPEKISGRTTLAIDTEGNIYSGTKPPEFIDLDGPIGEE